MLATALLRAQRVCLPPIRAKSRIASSRKGAVHVQAMSHQVLSTGTLMHNLDSETLSQRGQTIKTLKRCVHEAAAGVLARDTVVKTQGSVRRGTALQDISDADFYVLTSVPVTGRQREALKYHITEALANECIQMATPHMGENRIQFRSMQLYGQDLPNMDVVFSDFKGRTRVPPNTDSISQEAQYVVRYIKKLTEMYGNVSIGKGYLLEDVVIAQDNNIRAWSLKQGDGWADTAAHVDVLLFNTLMVLAGNSVAGDQQGWYPAKVSSAGMNTHEWRTVAAKVRRIRQQQGGWVWPA